MLPGFAYKNTSFLQYSIVLFIVAFPTCWFGRDSGERKDGSKNDERTEKPIKGKEAIREATSDSSYSTGLPTLGTIDYVNNYKALCWKMGGEINYSTPKTKL